MKWQYRFGGASAEGEALRQFRDMDRDGWEVVNCWRQSGELGFLLRRRPIPKSGEEVDVPEDEVGDETYGPES
jgi:hypothetical protein